MCNIHLYTAISIDGYIADSNQSVAWLDQYQTDYGFSEFLDHVDTLILGRVTYEQVLSFGAWPYEGKRVIVLTRDQTRMRGHAPHNVEFYSGDVRVLRHELADAGDSIVWLVGGARTNAQFLQHKLIDTLHLAIMPLTLGRGLPLFTPVIGMGEFHLAECRQFPDGVVMMRYDSITTHGATLAMRPEMAQLV